MKVEHAVSAARLLTGLRTCPRTWLACARRLIPYKQHDYNRIAATTLVTLSDEDLNEAMADLTDETSGADKTSEAMAGLTDETSDWLWGRLPPVGVDHPCESHEP